MAKKKQKKVAKKKQKKVAKKKPAITAKKKQKKAAKTEVALIWHKCEFELDGEHCSKETTRMFRVVKEHISDSDRLVQDLHVCDEHFPHAKALWESNNWEWKEVGKTR